jgi:hypothetical protein
MPSIVDDRQFRSARACAPNKKTARLKPGGFVFCGFGAKPALPPTVPSAYELAFSCGFLALPIMRVM